ncbi:MAG: hypothetical protein HYW01_07970 [Deltaproteobacteria bacterium]|nr:hypothetical protein [Deltaproteobacteria bacterium]
MIFSCHPELVSGSLCKDVMLNQARAEFISVFSMTTKPFVEFTLSVTNVLRVDSATKQSDTEFVISSPSTQLRINSTRNPDVSRRFDMTNE